MTTRPVPARLLPSLAVLPLIVAVTACATAGDAALASDTAGELAAGADELAALLEADESCRAIDHAESLLAEAQAGHAEGDVPDDVVARIEYVAQRVSTELDCEPTVARDDDADHENAADDADAGTDGAGRGDAHDESGGNRAEGNDRKGDDDKGNEGKGNEGKAKGKDNGKGKGRG